MVDKCIAVIKGSNGKCKFVGEVCNVNQAKFNEFKNEQSTCEQSELVYKKEVSDILEIHRKRALYLESKLLHLAKATYDNFVDKGYFDNDNDFQQMWYDYYFNGGELNIENAPREFKIIYERLVCDYEKH